MSYCKYVADLPFDNIHRKHHDCEYGFPLEQDSEFFCRLALEIHQAGLSWNLIMKKEIAIREAFCDFDVDAVASFDEGKIESMLSNPLIIRNRLKITSIIENAKTIKGLRPEYGGFKGWLEHHLPQSLEDWIKTFKKTFRFTGKEIVREFLMSTGYLAGAHDKGCEVYAEVLKHNPPWMRVRSSGSG